MGPMFGVFGWRALRPPRVVFVIGCVSCNTFSHFRQKNTTRGVGEGRAIRRPHYPTVLPDRWQRPACYWAGGRPQAPGRPFRGWLIPRVPYSGLDTWSHIGYILGADGCGPCYPPP